MRALQIPTNLNLEDLLIKKHSDFYAHLDKFYNIIYSIRMKWFSDAKFKELNHISKTARKKLFVSLNNQVLIKMYGAKYYRKILDILIAEGILETDNNYIYGKKSKGYRLSDKYLYAEIGTIYLKDKIMEKKINELELQEYDSLSNLSKSILEVLRTRFTFGNDSAYHLNDEMFKTHLIKREIFNRSKGQLEQIKNGNFYIVESKTTGRIFHNFSNIKSEFRNFITHISGDKLIEIDIANSQPFFLACLLTQLEQTEDIKKMIEIATSGKFYEFFRTAFKISDAISREDVKKQVLTMLYCPSYWEIKHLYTFKNIFPNVYKAIESIKADAYQQFAIILQRTEADLMINTVAPILLEKQIDFIAIHDSFMIQEKNLNAVISIIKNECLKKYNLVPILKVKGK